MKNDRMNIGKVDNAWIGSIRKRNMIKHDMTPGPQQTAVNIQFASGEWGNMRSIELIKNIPDCSDGGLYSSPSAVNAASTVKL